MIKFGISENYVSNWGMVQAIREVYQNFIDYGDYKVTVSKITENHSAVRISNDFKPTSWQFLKIGFSKKSGESIGKHGEGLKLAGLVFARNLKQFRIYTSLGRAAAAFYEDDNLGRCYGLELSDMQTEGFEVYFEADNKDLQMFLENKIEKKDILHTSPYGRIVDKPNGSIYIGGLYVCKLKNLKYALDFNPSSISLGRDREVPSSWDIQYYTGLIINACQKDMKLRASDVHNPEYSHGTIPSKIATKFKPEYNKQGKIVMRAGTTTVTKPNMIQAMIKDPVMLKRVQKLQQTKADKTRKSPNTLLKEFGDKLCLTNSEKLHLNVLLKLSENWTTKQ